MLYLDYQNGKYLHGMVCGLFQKVTIYISWDWVQQIDLPIGKTCLSRISSRV